MTHRRYHHGDLRRALIEAALAIIDREGVDALTIRRLAKEVGVSHAAPAHHFADKQAIVLAVATEGFRILGDHMRKLPEIDDPKERLTALGRGYLRFAFDHPAYYRVMFGPHKTQLVLDDAEFHAVASGTFEVLTKVVAPLVYREGDSDEERKRRIGAASISCWTHVHGNVMLWESGMFDHPELGRTWQAFEPMVENAVHFVAENLDHFISYPEILAVPTPPEHC